MTNQTEVENGTKVKFADESGEFTVSQWNGQRGWAGDEDGNGWFFTADQVVVVEAAEEENSDEAWANW